MVDQQADQERVEALGPAEQIINTLTTFTDHMVHNRPGIVSKDARTTIGARWKPVVWVDEDGEKIVYTVQKTKPYRTRVGILQGANEVHAGQAVVGEYRRPGLFPESVVYLYRQVAEVWKMDNEFAARWASWSFPREHKDLKVVLCAFMLAQSRKGDAVLEDGEVLFYDDDFRDVGEAMCLIRDKKADLNPKLLLRVGSVLDLSEVAEINRELGFANSARRPHRGRYRAVVKKWLRYREDNLPMLEGLVKAGFTSTVRMLAGRVGYKPNSSKFFEVLHWTQKQADDGRRQIAIGKDFSSKEDWTGMGEREICELITQDKPNWKRTVGLLPSDVGVTQAILAASIEAGCMSDKDLIILSPTIEEFGLHKVPAIRDRWKGALKGAEDQRAANIARNVKSKEMKEGLQDATDRATEKAFEEVTRALRVYCLIDKSSSMQGALDKAQGYLTKFLGGFPLDRLHVSVFNTVGTEIDIRVPKAAAVRQAFQGHTAGGGTSYGQGVRALSHRKPKPEEDALMLFVGDEEDTKYSALVTAIQESEINPVAFGLLRVLGTAGCSHGRGEIVRNVANRLGIPCFNIDENMFESDDPYAITRLLQNLIAATPVGERVAGRAPAARKSRVQEILGTALLKKPIWA